MKNPYSWIEDVDDDTEVETLDPDGRKRIRKRLLISIGLWIGSVVLMVPIPILITSDPASNLPLFFLFPLLIMGLVGFVGTFWYGAKAIMGRSGASELKAMENPGGTALAIAGLGWVVMCLVGRGGTEASDPLEVQRAGLLVRYGLIALFFGTSSLMSIAVLLGWKRRRESLGGALLALFVCAIPFSLVLVGYLDARAKRAAPPELVDRHEAAAVIPVLRDARAVTSELAPSHGVLELEGNGRLQAVRWGAAMSNEMAPDALDTIVRMGSESVGATIRETRELTEISVHGHRAQAAVVGLFHDGFDSELGALVWLCPETHRYFQFQLFADRVHEASVREAAHRSRCHGQGAVAHAGVPQLTDLPEGWLEYEQTESVGIREYESAEGEQYVQLVHRPELRLTSEEAEQWEVFSRMLMRQFVDASQYSFIPDGRVWTEPAGGAESALRAGAAVKSPDGADEELELELRPCGAGALMVFYLRRGAAEGEVYRIGEGDVCGG